MRLALIVLLVAASGCLQRATRPVRELPPQATAHVEQPVVDYRTGSTAPVGDEYAPLRERFEAGFSTEARASLRYEPRLDAIARALGETWVITGQSPVAALKQWMLWKAGVVGDLRGSFVVSGSGTERQFDEPLTQWAARVQPQPDRPLAYGLVRFGGALGDTIQVLVTVSDDVELAPVKKAVAAGEALTISGRFRVTPSSATLFLDDDDARVRQVRVPVKPDGSFAIDVKAASKPGRRMLELTWLPADEAPGVQGWRHSACLLPLYVDVPEPTQPDVSIRAPAPNSPDATAWPGEVAARYNQRRLELQLAPLEQSDVLERLAKDYAAQQVANPETPPDGALPRKVAGAGIVSHAVTQHRARSEFIDELVRTNLQRPAFRADLLAPGRLAFGFGLAPLKDGEWESSAVVAAVTPVLDPEVENARLLERLQAVRQEKSQPTFATLPAMSAAVQALVQASCDSGDPLTTLGPIVEALERAGWGGKVSGTSVVGAWVQPESVASAFPEAVASTATHVAIGSCQFKKGPSVGRQLVGLVHATLAQNRKR
jgi:hypothetical protein